MADQKPRIKFKWLVLQLKSSCFCFKTSIVGLWVFVLCICSVLAATSPPSEPYSAAATTEQGNFIGITYTDTYTNGIAVGSMSNSLYYLYSLYSSSTLSSSAAVRKVDASRSQTWMASFSFWPIIKSLSVDAAEQSVYLASQTNPLVVLKLTASDGSIVSQHQL